MNILIIGGGGREHALAWKAAQDERVHTVYVAPGNAGTANEPKVTNIPILADDIDALLQFAQQHHIDLTIVGPEAPLTAGIVDRFSAVDLPIFGPTQQAAQLEGSKSFSKAFLARHHIPTADYATFTSLEAAKNYIQQQPMPLVIKADGLAAGKGVVIAHTIEEAETAAQEMLCENRFGQAGAQIVIEAFLQGEEASFIILADGEHMLPLATSQDHKTLGEGDTGPNTGGMGAYSPAPVVTDAVYQRIIERIITPTLQGMISEGMPYTGFLYVGLMITDSGDPKVIEFNCRCGDPETQPIMMRLQSSIVQLCEQTLAKNLKATQAHWHQQYAVSVVMASEGYPNRYTQGHIISGLQHAATLSGKVFHSGTAYNEQQDVITQGGRVLSVSAMGKTVQQAQYAAYQLAQSIQWSGCYYRRDIAHRAIEQ